MYNNIATCPPLIIIERIMQYASFISETQESQQWKFKIPLLAVCRSWRKHGLHWIYRYAFYVDLKVSVNGLVNTNIQLISDSQYSRYTKNLLIRLGNLKCLSRFLDDYENIFKFDTNSWIFISKFDFIINDRSAIPDRFTEDSDSDGKDCYFADFSQRIAQFMPRIAHINLQYKDDSSISKSANTALFNAYGCQLASLNVFHISSFTPTQFLDSLTMLIVKFNPETENLLPAIDCSKLVKMYLSEIPFKFSWKYFCRDNGDFRKVNFAQLHTLSLSYMDDPIDFDMFLPDEDGNEEHLANIEQFVVYFPQLRVMNITNSVGEPLLRSTYILPKVLNNLNLFNSFNMLDKLANSDLQGVNIAELQFSTTELEEDKFYEYTNWIFGAKSSKNRGSLTLYKCDFKLDWERIKWTNVTSLNLNKCDVRTLTTVIYYSTNLKNLAINEIALEGITDSLYSIASINTGDASFRTMKPNDSMKFLEICKVENINDTFDHAVILFQTLMELFRNLKKFTVCRPLVKPLVQFAGKYKSDYPHFDTLIVDTPF